MKSLWQDTSTYDKALVGILLILLYFPILGHLGNQPIRIWDEARQAISAVEMAESGNVITTTFYGEPDLWNTKPPLLIWLQALSFKIFGIDEVTFRLPTAMAALFTCLAIFLLLYRRGKSLWWAMASVLTLITSWGYIGEHAARTGDYDAMVAMFILFYTLTFYKYCEGGRSRYILLTFLFMAMAFLTKSVAGLFGAPALLVYSLLTGNFIRTLRGKYTYLGLFTFVVLVGGYHFLREMQGPGYLAAVWENDMGGRFSSTLENHVGRFSHYWEFLKNEGFWCWILLLPLGAILGIQAKDKAQKRIAILASLQMVLIFLIISNAKTKLFWYATPMYPFMAILVGFAIYMVIEWLSKAQATENLLSSEKGVWLAVLFSIFMLPYYNICNKYYLYEETNMDTYRLPLFFKTAGKEIDGAKICYEFNMTGDYFPHVIFHKYVLAGRGINIDFVKVEALKVGDKVIVAEDEAKGNVQSKFHITELFNKGYIFAYAIDSIKHDPIHRDTPLQ